MQSPQFFEVVHSIKELNCKFTPLLTHAGTRSADGSDAAHENAEGMACVGVRVERPVRRRLTPPQEARFVSLLVRAPLHVFFGLQILCVQLRGHTRRKLLQRA